MKVTVRACRRRSTVKFNFGPPHSMERRFTISAELLLSLITLGEHAGGYAVRRGIPADAVLLSARLTRGSLEMLVSSEIFEGAPGGAPVRPDIIIPRGLA